MQIHDRFKDAPWFGGDVNIIMVGLGGIGSWTGLLLSRMGYKLTVYDNDVLEGLNIGGQLHSKDFVSKFKTQGFSETVSKYSEDGSVTPVTRLFTEKEPNEFIMISAVDNMATRKLMFEKWLEAYKTNKEVCKGEYPCIFIDGRMTAEIGQVFVVKDDDTIERYKDTLFSDEEAEELPCSFKATSHCGAKIGAEIVGVLANYIANHRKGMDLRDVPFSIIFSFASQSHEIKN